MVLFRKLDKGLIGLDCWNRLGAQEHENCYQRWTLKNLGLLRQVCLPRREEEKEEEKKDCGQVFGKGENCGDLAAVVTDK